MPTEHEQLPEALKAEFPGKPEQWYEDVAANMEKGASKEVAVIMVDQGVSREAAELMRRFNEGAGVTDTKFA
ncbi:MAG: hypothetical protein LBC57_05415 [Treponema sp.]|nr:hypothetical protein [Treponema sp.]